MSACCNRDEAAAVELMEATKLAGALDLQGGHSQRSALHVASVKGLAGTVAKLLSHGADAALTDEDGKTALWLACDNGHEAAAAELMEATKRAGALDLQVGDSKRSALHVASDKGLAGTVAKLLSHGADAALADEHGKTALDYAKADEVKAALREHGGKHSLFYAVSEGMPELFATLIEESADVHARDNGGKTPLDYAKTEEVKAVFAKHSLLAAIRFDRDEQVAEHIAAGADLKARDSLGWTALLLACAHGHEAAAALLAEPSQAAGVLDAVGDDGFSALLWAEERGLGSVAQKLRECGAAAVRRPALALFRGECGAVQIKVAERTVAFAHSFVTVRSAQRCPLGGKGYYELEILELDDKCPQYGFAAPAFARVLGASGEGVGDDEHSWAVDGARQRKWHVSSDAGGDQTNTARLSEAFSDLDLDGDGVLSLEEFTPLAKMLGAKEDEDVQEPLINSTQMAMAPYPRASSWPSSARHSNATILMAWPMKRKRGCSNCFQGSACSRTPTSARGRRATSSASRAT